MNLTNEELHDYVNGLIDARLKSALADIKWSQFPAPGNSAVGDVIVGPVVGIM